MDVPLHLDTLRSCVCFAALAIFTAWHCFIVAADEGVIAGTRLMGRMRDAGMRAIAAFWTHPDSEGQGQVHGQ